MNSCTGGGGGYYADPLSPIASTPLKRKRNKDNQAGQNSTTSVVVAQENIPIINNLLKRKLTDAYPDSPGSNTGSTGSNAAEPQWGDKVVSLFSPVLKFFSGASDVTDDDEVLAPAAAVDVNVVVPEPEHSAADVCNTSYRTEEDSEEFEFCPYFFMKSLPQYDQVAIPNRLPALPPANLPKLSLVLDLDETLVHCSVHEVENADLKFPVEYEGMEYIIHARKRPHMDHFLEQVAKQFEVVVFTASQKAYASKLLDLLDPDNRLIKHRLYRDDCLPVDGNFLKDLTVLGRDLAQVVLVDNSPHAFGFQVSNGIPIESWFDDNEDSELLKLLPFLESLLLVDDVRPVVANQFRIQERINAAALSTEAIL